MSNKNKFILTTSLVWLGMGLLDTSYPFEIQILGFLLMLAAGWFGADIYRVLEKIDDNENE